MDSLEYSKEVADFILNRMNETRPHKRSELFSVLGIEEVPLIVAAQEEQVQATVEQSIIEKPEAQVQSPNSEPTPVEISPDLQNLFYNNNI